MPAPEGFVGICLREGAQVAVSEVQLNLERETRYELAAATDDNWATFGWLPIVKHSALQTHLQTKALALAVSTAC